MNYPNIPLYNQNFTLDMINNNYTLNLFSDASMRTVSKQGNVLASCYGSVAVVGDTIIDEIFRIQSTSTVPAAEIRGIRCSLILALKHRYEYGTINIFSDSQISLFSLRDYIYNWYFDDDIKRFRSKSSNNEVKNQELLIECYMMLQELRKTNVVNLFHQNGHVGESTNDIKNALLSFKEANGIKGVIGYDLIRYISLYNNYVDNKSRSFIRTTNIIDNNYYDAVSILPTKDFNPRRKL